MNNTLDTGYYCPGFFISALKGGSGKTIISLGIIAELVNRGKNVAPFKKGPDYIDAGWLQLAAKNPCYNLDTFLLDEETVIDTYLKHTLSINKDIAVIEGNRGLFDGTDIYGKTSTAETAKLLNAPVFLVLDCTKSTRTMAAAVLGCLHFDSALTIGGVILNRVAGLRHKNNLINNIEYHTGVHVIGSVPKLRTHDFPERHMGLVPTPEHDWALQSIKKASDIVNENINIDTLCNITAETYQGPERKILKQPCYEIKPSLTEKPVIGVIKDSAFQFYYPENIESLEFFGAKIRYISPLSDAELPTIDALYIGGGFPETHAKEISENMIFNQQVKDLAETGLPIYAECGGLMYMGESLTIDDIDYKMTGVFPIQFGISKKPQGHGYVIAEVTHDTPYYAKGDIIKGHEFRYSKILSWDKTKGKTAFEMKRGTGIEDKKDGIFYKNVFATYVHIHALGTPGWAEKMVENACRYKKRRV